MPQSSLKLRLNMDKTKITHVNDGFIFLCTDHSQTQSLWRDASGLNDPAGESRRTVVTLTALLSGNYSESKVDMAEQLNRKTGKAGPCSISSLI